MATPIGPNDLSDEGRLRSPHWGAQVITPSDTVTFTTPYTGLLPSGSGTITVTMASGDDSVPLFAVAGQEIRAIVQRVYATGTSAGVITGLR